MPNSRLLTFAIITFFVGSIFLSCQTAIASSDDWPMYQHDPAHTGVSLTRAQVYPVLKWNHTTLAHGIAVSNGLAYYLASWRTVSILECVNASTGKQVWQEMLFDSYSQISPAIVDGVVYIDTAAYNATTGKKILDYSIYDGTTSPTVVEGLIFLAGNTNSGSAYVFAVDTQTGRLVWNTTEIVGSFNGDYIDDYIVQSPIAVQNGIAYFASGRGVYAIDEKTGNKIWNYPLPNYLSKSSGSVLVAEQFVFAHIGDQLYCLDVVNGAKVWNTPAKGFLALANDMIIAGDSAYNVSSGEKIWSLGLDSLSTPAIAGDAIYYSHSFLKDGNSNKFTNELLGVKLSTGKIFWNYPFPENSYQNNGNLQLQAKCYFHQTLDKF